MIKSKSKRSAARAADAPENAGGWEAQWLRQFNHLKEFRRKSPGRWPRPSEEFPAGNGLGQWAQRQRIKYASRELPKDRVAALDRLSFPWEKKDERDEHWNQQFEHLKAYRSKYPDKWPFAREDFPKGNRLGLWVWRQRQNYARGTLPKARMEQLRRLGFPLELPDSWGNQLKALRDFRRKHPGRWPKAREEFPEGNRLGLWCHLQRCAHKVGKLKDDRVRQLEKLGFEWSVKDASWQRNYEAMKEYKRKNPKGWPEIDGGSPQLRKLVYWANAQRARKRDRRLSADKVALLNKLGFRW